MDTTSIGKPAETVPTDSPLLPAGSTLEVFPGVHVPHPHAEVNLPGAGDPRLGDTRAISEVIVPEGTKRVPLLDSIRPKALTVDPAKRPLPETPVATQLPAPDEAQAGEHLAEEPAK